jgi:hypothetical protein
VNFRRRPAPISITAHPPPGSSFALLFVHLGVVSCLTVHSAKVSPLWPGAVEMRCCGDFQFYACLSRTDKPDTRVSGKGCQYENAQLEEEPQTRLLLPKERSRARRQTKKKKKVNSVNTAQTLFF